MRAVWVPSSTTLPLLSTTMRNRVSDAINEDQRLFVSLTDVVINDKDRAEFVAINKNLIESIVQL